MRINFPLKAKSQGQKSLRVLLTVTVVNDIVISEIYSFKVVVKRQ